MLERFVGREKRQETQSAFKNIGDKPAADFNIPLNNRGSIVVWKDGPNE